MSHHIQRMYISIVWKLHWFVSTMLLFSVTRKCTFVFTSVRNITHRIRQLTIFAQYSNGIFKYGTRVDGFIHTQPQPIGSNLEAGFHTKALTALHCLVVMACSLHALQANSHIKCKTVPKFGFAIFNWHSLTGAECVCVWISRYTQFLFWQWMPMIQSLAMPHTHTHIHTLVDVSVVQLINHTTCHSARSLYRIVLTNPHAFYYHPITLVRLMTAVFQHFSTGRKIRIHTTIPERCDNLSSIALSIRMQFEMCKWVCMCGGTMDFMGSFVLFRCIDSFSVMQVTLATWLIPNKHKQTLRPHIEWSLPLCRGSRVNCDWYVYARFRIMFQLYAVVFCFDTNSIAIFFIIPPFEWCSDTLIKSFRNQI